MTTFAIKRIYDEASDGDGRRILVDRLWPRGVAKESAAIDEWAKNVTPSSELRKSFHAGELDHEAFAARYRDELEESGAVSTLADGLPKKVTLVTAVKDVDNSHVPVLLAELRRHNG